MLTLKSNILLAVMILSRFAFSAEILKTDRDVTAFSNYASPGSILLLSSDGRANWVLDAKQTKVASYKITDKDCVPASQSTADMGDTPGMLLAYPFLVGMAQACVIDKKTNSIHSIAKFTDLPENAYSLTYAGDDSTTSYFIMNGKPWASDGYLFLVSIDKTNFSVKLRQFATAVPGSSGAMWRDSKSLWITSWPGEIYEIPNDRLLAAIKSGGKLVFSQLATRRFAGIDGMSLFMMGNDDSLLYYNTADYESYTVNRTSGARNIIKPPCEPISGAQKDWLILCNGRSLQTWRE